VVSVFRNIPDLERAIARVVGVEPDETYRITIDIRGDGPPTVRISKYLTVDQEDALIRIFEAVSFEEKATFAGMVEP
jgi:hypothetical protein